jgi:hypothetical protein
MGAAARSGRESSADAQLRTLRARVRVLMIELEARDPRTADAVIDLLSLVVDKK